MLNIKDRVIGYNHTESSLYLDDHLIATEENNRLVDMREKFIRSIYQLLKSEDFKDFHLKHGEQMDVNIHIKNDAIEIEY